MRKLDRVRIGCVSGSSRADHAPVSKLCIPDVSHDDGERRILCVPHQTSCVGWQFSGKEETRKSELSLPCVGDGGEGDVCFDLLCIRHS